MPYCGNLRLDLRLVIEVALFCSKLSFVYTCTKNTQCPRGQICQQENGYCRLEHSYTESSSNATVLAPVGGILALCLGILIFFICYRRYTKKRRRECGELNGDEQGNCATIRYERTEGSANTQNFNINNTSVCSSSTQNHLNLGFELLNPPPYFSIFTLITQEGNDVQRTVLATSEIQEVEVVWEQDGDFPPAYDTLSLGPPWPPAYSEIGSDTVDNDHRELDIN